MEAQPQNERHWQMADNEVAIPYDGYFGFRARRRPVTENQNLKLRLRKNIQVM